jgi:hypothetical protein
MTKIAKKEKETALAVPVIEEDWERQMRERAKDVKSALTVGVPRISHKGGVLTIDKNRVKDNRLAVVVLGMTWVKEHYEHEYEEGSSDTPNCYAFGLKERGLVPFPNVPQKQADACDPCPHNQFNTATKGRGKRCQDKPRLLLLLAGDIAARGDQPVGSVIAKAQHYQISIPATSLAAKGAEGMGLNKYVGSLGENTDHGDLTEAITEIGTEPRKEGGYFVVLKFLGKTPREAMPYLAKRAANVSEFLAQPFPVIAKEEQDTNNKPVKGQTKGKR